MKHWKAVAKELRPKLKQICKEINNHSKAIAEADQQAVVVARKTMHGRACGGQQGQGGRSRRQGQGRGRGSGKVQGRVMSGSDSEGESEEDSEGESSSNTSGSSKASESGGEHQLGDACGDGLAGITVDLTW